MSPRLGLRRGARALGLRLGLVPYRPWLWSEERWEAEYRGGTQDYFGDLVELPRYSLVAGYVDFLGGRPEILDVGCGPGLLRRRLARLDFARYVGVDPSEAAIERARSLADERTEFVLGDPLHAELGTFDVVVANEVLSVVADPPALADRLVELVRADGHLVTSIWRHAGDGQLWRLLDDRFERLDTVEARNPANEKGPRGWRVALHKQR